MLARFVPLGVRDPDFDDRGARPAVAPTSGLLGPGIIAGVVLTIGGALLLAGLDAMQAMRATPPVPFDIGGALWRLSHPEDVNGWVQIVGILAFALIGGMFIAATRVNRTSSGRS
jgi:PAT family beta-lactamase induction signal transducer AmpG